MLIFQKTCPNFNEGAYAVVFFTSDGRATKVFRQRSDVNEEHVEKVFQSEVQAYRLAADCLSLRTLVPSFYGSVSVAKITNADGIDISNEFYLCRAYQMQKIDGEFVKLGNLTEPLRQPIIERFRSVGIRHTCDASAIVNKGKVMKVIDFATEEFVLEHPP